MKDFIKEEAQQAISGIYCMVDWYETSQGFEYWSTVIDNLKKLIAENEREKE